MSARERVERAFARLVEVDRPEVWISLGDRDALCAEADALDVRVAAGDVLPLAGLVMGVKDNIDVAGFNTTAGSAAYAYMPGVDATAVGRLRAAGALVIGKTNLDQFATGLVGSRSPYGAVRNAWSLEHISGGSSAGSGVAVALGIVDFALGTDTAGSGRVPAALNGIIGLKPTPGQVPNTGVVPACRSIDCVTVFSRDIALAQRVRRIMAGPDGKDVSCVTREQHPFREQISIAIPQPSQLEGMDQGWDESFTAAVADFQDLGVSVDVVDISPLLDAAQMLYGSSFVAERYAAVGDFIATHQELIGRDLDPTVAQIVLAGAEHTASDLYRDFEQLAQYRAVADELFSQYDALLTPTTTSIPTLAQVAKDPIGANSALGRFTNFANLLGLSAVAFPGRHTNGLPFGLMFTATGEREEAVGSLISQFQNHACDIVVFGAHMMGEPLNHQLVAAGGTLLDTVVTAQEYKMFEIEGDVPKPGVLRVASGGVSLTGERWRLPASGFGHFIASLLQPMSVGSVELLDGSQVTGFMVEPIAVEGATDISEYGGWRPWIHQAVR